MTEQQTSIARDIYHIRVGSHLDDRWADWFEGFAIVPRASGETLLTGVVADQAALHGVLTKIRDLNLPLLLVARADCPCPKNCPRHACCAECATYHGAKGKIPYCLRERTKWDKQCAALTQVR